MDLNETTGEVLNRHPWELSRTKCSLNAFSKYLNQIYEDGREKKYVNVGAGDLYFDKALFSRYKKSRLYAVDIAYRNKEEAMKRIYKFHYLEEISEKEFDYAIMMDSLEYMEDDAAYVRNVTQRIRKGGYFFLTLPAFPILFSDYDVNIKNLRRYSHKSLALMLSKVPELVIEEEYNFYTSLFMVRFVQKFMKLPIDPNHNFTAHWAHSEKGFVTRFLTGCLNIDFGFNRLLSRIGIRIPGLSMLVICKKVK